MTRLRAGGLASWFALLVGIALGVAASLTPMRAVARDIISSIAFILVVTGTTGVAASAFRDAREAGKGVGRAAWIGFKAFLEVVFGVIPL
jgi:hypothetical protein